MVANSVKVLLVGLEGQDLKVVSTVVGQACNYMLLAQTAAEALTYVSSQHPQIVVVDSMVKGMSAVEFTKALLAEDPDVLIVIVGLYQDEQIIDSLKAGASDFIPRPISEDELSLALNRFFGVISRRECKRFHSALFDGARLELSLKTTTEALSHAVSIISNFLTSACAGHELIRIELGIQELLRNALEHGNLAIDYELKKGLCESGKFDDFVKQQSDRAQADGKKIQVSVELQEDTLTCRIADSGPGFDWRSYRKNRNHSPSDSDMSGRGLLLISKIFDSVTYNDKGNEVICSKRLLLPTK